MSITVTPFLRNSLLLDAVVSGAAGLLLLFGGSLVASLTALPTGLLFWAGLLIVPFVMALIYAARQREVSRLLVLNIIVLNALWVAASFGILIAGLVQPNMLGVAFVSAQALAVGLFAVLQTAGLRKGTIAAAA